MKTPTIDTRIVNEDRVSALLDNISEPAVRNLVTLAISAARMRFIRWKEQPEEVWRASLPSADFDIAFFAELMVQIFSRRDLITKLLDGTPLDEAAGWSVEEVP